MTPVVLEGIRRVDEWAEDPQRFPHDGRSRSRCRARPTTSQGPLSRQVLGLAAAGKTMAEISLELRRSEFETAALFFDLYNRGAPRGGPGPERHAQRRPRGGDAGAPRPRLPPTCRSTATTPRSRPTRRCSPSTASTRTPRRASSPPWKPASAREALQDRPPRQGAPTSPWTWPRSPARTSIARKASCCPGSTGTWDVQSILKLCPLDQGRRPPHLRPPAREEGHRVALVSWGGAVVAPPPNPPARSARVNRAPLAARC